jgi:hypothetical protein
VLIRVGIKTRSNGEEGNARVVQSVHAMVHRGIYGVPPDFVRKREVIRVCTFSCEAVVEIDRPLLVRARCGITRI